MKIGLDLHGVITDMPEFFKFFCESIIKNGGKIIILTGGKSEVAKKELSDLGFKKDIHFNGLFSVIDYMIQTEEEFGLYKRVGYNEKFDNPEYSDDEWNSIKGYYCKIFNIDLMIDDSTIYQQYFSTPFAKLSI